MRTIPVLFTLLVGCSGGGDDDTGIPTGPGGCDALTTAPLTTVPSEQWPTGTAESIQDYLGVSGRWDVDNSCGDPTAVKITIQSEELLELVQTPWADGSSCGCLTDPTYEADSQYDVIALHEKFLFFVETFDDPGVQAETVEGAGALFGSGAPLRFRGCGTQNIDPIANSTWDLLTTILRIDGSGGMNGTILLATDAGETQTCELTNWTFVADN